MIFPSRVCVLGRAWCYWTSRTDWPSWCPCELSGCSWKPHETWTYTPTNNAELHAFAYTILPCTFV